MIKKFLCFISIFAIMFLFNSSVFAEVDDCYKDYLNPIDISKFTNHGYYYDNTSDSWIQKQYGNMIVTFHQLLKIEDNTMYFNIFEYNKSFSLWAISTYDDNKKLIDFQSKLNTQVLDGNILSISINNSDIKYISLIFMSMDWTNLRQTSYYGFSTINLSTCPPVIPDPPKPDTPTIETDQSKLLSNFYTTCIDRINFLANYFADSKIFIACFTIPIVIFVFFLVRRGYLS